MKRYNHVFLVSFIVIWAILGASQMAWGQKPNQKKYPSKKQQQVRKPLKKPVILHTPPYQEKANRNLEMIINLDGEWLIREVRLFYRVVGQTNYRSVLFLRGEQQNYYAVVPQRDVTYPGLEYYIAALDLKGRWHPHYATAVLPHRIQIRRANSLGVWLAKLERHQHTRSTLGLMGELNSYGAHGGLSYDSSSRNQQPDLDAFYTIELWYTYRILSIFYQITVGYGRLRGDVPLSVPSIPGGNVPTAPNVLRAGLDYGFSKLYMEFHRYFGVDIKLVLGASDRGFDGGAGATLRIGNLVETHLDLGFEIVSRLGWTVFFELAWDTVPWFLMALRAEVTTMPFFDDRAIAARAYFKAHILIHKHFHTFVHIGYGRRRSVPNGGPLLQIGLLANF